MRLVDSFSPSALSSPGYSAQLLCRFVRCCVRLAVAAMVFAVVPIGANAQAVVGVTALNSGLNVGSANVCLGGRSTPAPCFVTGTVTFQFTSSGSISAPLVLTQGTTNLDFSDAGTGTCNTNGSSHVYNAGDTCTVDLKFTPMYAGMRPGAVNIYDARGPGIWYDIAATAYVVGTGAGPEAVFSSASRKVIAHYNKCDDTDNCSSDMKTEDNYLWVDAAGNFYVYDFVNQSWWMVGYFSANGYSTPTFISQNLEDWPFAFDGGGNAWVPCQSVCPQYNSDVYGLLYVEYGDPYGEYGETNSGITSANGIAVDGRGDLFVGDVSGTPNEVKEIPVGCASPSCVVTLGGNFSQISNLAVDTSGDLFVTDLGTGTVREMVAAGGYVTVNTLASGLNQPRGIAVDALGNVYFAEYGAGRLKEIVAAGGYGTIRVLAADLNAPNGVGVDAMGNVYVMDGDPDSSDTRVTKFDFSTPPVLSFARTTVGLISTDSPQTVTITNFGNQNLDLSALSYAADFAEAGGVSTDCNSSTPLIPGHACTLTINFSPQASSLTSAETSLNENVTVTGDNLNGATVLIAVSGTATAAPILTWPIAGSTLSGASVTFRWNRAGVPSDYLLKLSTTHFGGSDVFGGTTSGTSITVPGIPTNGATLYAQLSYKLNGAWTPLNYSFIEAGSPTPPVMTSPAPGSTLDSSDTFTWSPGAGPASYQLKISAYHFGGTDVFKGNTTSTSLPVPGIPTNGAPLYVELEYNATGTWIPIQYSYMESGTVTRPAMISPAPGSILQANNTFTWSAGKGPIAYELKVGLAHPGGGDLYETVSDPYWHNNSTSANLSNLRMDGATVYVTLQYKVGDTWTSIPYVYTEGGTSGPPVLSASAVPYSHNWSFSWSSGPGPADYVLKIGTTEPGSSNVYFNQTDLTGVVIPIPEDGVPFYTTLEYKATTGGPWIPVQNTYQEIGTPTPPAITSPSVTDPFTSSTVKFTWSRGRGPIAYRLRVGTTGVGSSDITEGIEETSLSETVSGIPTDGRTVYVTLGYKLGTTWHAVPYTYPIVGPVMTSPVPGSTLSGSSVTFNWSAAVDSATYDLLVGTSPGSADLFSTIYGGLGTLSQTVNNLPTNGETIYVTLRYKVGSVWYAVPYTYKEAGGPAPAGMAPTTSSLNVGSANVCPNGSNPVPCSVSATVTFQFTQSESILAPVIVTQGTDQQDFVSAGTGTCLLKQDFNAGDSCTVDINFQPKSPGVREGAVMLYAGTPSELLAIAYVYGRGNAPEVEFPGNPVRQVIASYDKCDGSGVGCPSSDSKIVYNYLFVDGPGDVYVYDHLRNQTEIIEYLASSGYGQSSVTDSASGTISQFTLDGGGNVFSSCEPATCAVGSPVSFAVSGRYEIVIINAGITAASGIAVDSAGDVFVGDTGSTPARVREIPAGCNSSTCVVTLAGSFTHPYSLTLDNAHDLFVTDDAAGTVSEIVASGGYATSNTLATGLNHPRGAAVDGTGNVFFSEYGAGTLREIFSATGYTTTRTLASDLNVPDGVGVDASGNVYVVSATPGTSDFITLVTRFSFTTPPTLSFGSTAVGHTSTDSPQTVTVTNGGNESLDLSALSYPADFPEASGVATDCKSSTPLAAGSSCTLTVDFSPLSTTTPSALTESVTLTNENLNSHTVAVGVTGTATTGP